MPSLHEIEARFAAKLTRAAVDHDPRIEVYRNTVRANYRNALAATYSVVRELVGAPFFNAAVDAYVDAYPSVSGDLNVLGDRFGDFLADYPAAATLPYLADVARLEWAIDEANRAADVQGAPEDVIRALGQVPSELIARQTLGLHPSCRLIASTHPVFKIWQWHRSQRDEGATVEFGGEPDCLQVRREGDDVAIERLPPADFAWLRALAHDSDLATALDAAVKVDADFDVGGALARYIANRTITGVGSALKETPDCDD
jgi:hypothetical protein